MLRRTLRNSRLVGTTSFRYCASFPFVFSAEVVSVVRRALASIWPIFVSMAVSLRLPRSAIFRLGARGGLLVVFRACGCQDTLRMVTPREQHDRFRAAALRRLGSLGLVRAAACMRAHLHCGKVELALEAPPSGDQHGARSGKMQTKLPGCCAICRRSRRPCSTSICAR